MGRSEEDEPEQATAPRECGQWRGTSELRGLVQWARHCPKAGSAVNGGGPRSCVWGSGLCLPRSGSLELIKDLISRSRDQILGSRGPAA